MLEHPSKYLDGVSEQSAMRAIQSWAQVRCLLIGAPPGDEPELAEILAWSACEELLDASVTKVDIVLLSDVQHIAMSAVVESGSIRFVWTCIAGDEPGIL